mmetsp:Transcript_35572/g.74988  ORF Transcript_35572/g.74988 Transcript_35572/m.74988 type:complete len:329 (-) Transcript_35572:209-1195(-)|eukprot:CAMPEP_0183735288 /NCGR_PEP_ID=MMETSP0737-20130205/46223_1 /TAXON_ID=385413 /ORGANISM="Thalassiosira miniscula, Strain CCMP1093" /LENGTH=328 /DNA_ID=CAMNT_0025968985 /DNA_START=103 /DNA_END=1089 /DNA_ORIENTATION=+
MISVGKMIERKIIYFLIFALIVENTYITWSQHDFSSQIIDANCEGNQPHLWDLSPKTRAHRVDNSTLPYKCGIVFFYHVPSTGGATINQWLVKYTSKYGGNAQYFTTWGRDDDGRGKPQFQQKFAEGTGKDLGMKEFVKNLRPDEWRISHCHHSAMHLNISEHLLVQWRQSVESQGCHFVASVMFRDPLSHALSLFKHLKRFNHTKESYLAHLHNPSELGPWQTNLDYFLYNILARNPDGVGKEAKVTRALDLLQKHFDIVTVGNHAGHKRELLRLTGWEDIEMTRTNSHSRDIDLTKREVEGIQKSLDDNGDIDFIERVKHIFRDRF